MRLATTPINHLALRAFAALLRRWLGIMLACVMAGVRRGEAPGSALLHRAERRLKKLLFASAVERLPPRRRRAHTPPDSAPRGFRRVRRDGGDLRQLTRNVLPKLRTGAPRARLARIQHVLDHIDAFVARLRKRLQHNQPATHLIAVTPPARNLISDAQAFAVSGADTS